MAKKRMLEFGNVVLCDYAGMGHGNKHVLVNCYSGSVILQSFPASLGFCLYIELLSRQPDCISMRLELLVDKEKLAEIAISIEKRDINESSAIVIPQFNLNVDRECVFNVQASCAGFSRKTILSKKIMLPPGELADAKAR